MILYSIPSWSTRQPQDLRAQQPHSPPGLLEKSQVHLHPKTSFPSYTIAAQTLWRRRNWDDFWLGRWVEGGCRRAPARFWPRMFGPTCLSWEIRRGLLTGMERMVSRHAATVVALCTLYDMDIDGALLASVSCMMFTSNAVNYHIWSKISYSSKTAYMWYFLAITT